MTRKIHSRQERAHDLGLNVRAENSSVAALCPCCIGPEQDHREVQTRDTFPPGVSELLRLAMHQHFTIFRDGVGIPTKTRD